MRLTFFSLLFLPLLAMAQVTTCVSIENEVGDSLAGTYTFDVYLSTGAGSSGDLYLATSDVQVRYSAGNFTSPVLTALDNPMPPLGAIQNGYCTMIPTSTDNGGIVDWLSQAAYHGALATSISGDLLSINLNTISVSSSNILTTIAKVDGMISTHRLGKFQISGYTGNGAGLRIDTVGLLPTRVYTYQTTSPYSALTTSLTTCTALSLEWLSFQAKVTENQHVDLFWSTQNEVGITHFELERKYGNQSWQRIVDVPAKGQYINHYTFTDLKPLPTKISYRLRQIDIDGSSQYSKELRIILGEGPQVWVYPNPVADQLNVMLSDDLFGGEAQISLMDIHGKEVWKQVGLTPIPMTKLAAGSYLYRIVLRENSFQGIISKH